MDSASVTAIGACIVAAVGAVVGVVNSNRANKPAELTAQLAWVKSAQDDAAAAKAEAKEAKAEAAQARRDSEATHEQSVQLRRDFEAIQDWVDRVVRAADAYRRDVTDSGGSIDDSGVHRLLNAINGGPRMGPRG